MQPTKDSSLALPQRFQKVQTSRVLIVCQYCVPNIGNRARRIPPAVTGLEWLWHEDGDIPKTSFLSLGLNAREASSDSWYRHRSLEVSPWPFPKWRFETLCNQYKAVQLSHKRPLRYLCSCNFDSERMPLRGTNLLQPPHLLWRLDSDMTQLRLELGCTPHFERRKGTHRNDGTGCGVLHHPHTQSYGTSTVREERPASQLLLNRHEKWSWAPSLRLWSGCCLNDLAQGTHLRFCILLSCFNMANRQNDSSTSGHS